MQNEMRRELKKMIANIIEVDDFNDDDDFFAQLGVDSMIALEIKNAISRDVGVNVPVVLFLKGITATELADHLAKNFKKSPEAAKAPKPAARSYEIDLNTLSVADLNKIIQAFGRPVAAGGKAAA